jgi:hypothetical protein
MLQVNQVNYNNEISTARIKSVRLLLQIVSAQLIIIRSISLYDATSHQQVSFVWWCEIFLMMVIKPKHNVLLTVHRNISVQQDQQDVLFAFSLLQLISSTCFEQAYCSSGGGTVLYI